MDARLEQFSSVESLAGAVGTALRAIRGDLVDTTKDQLTQLAPLIEESQSPVRLAEFAETVSGAFGPTIDRGTLTLQSDRILSLRPEIDTVLPTISALSS